MFRALNLGCGNIPKLSTDEVEWVNVEKYYVPGHPWCGWLAEEYTYIEGDMISVLQDTPAESVDIIHIVHALEHVSTDDSRIIIRECYRVLKPGGVIEIETPDIDKACRLWLDGNQSERIMGLFWGTMGADGEGQFHLTGFNFNRYEYDLSSVGFKDVVEIPVGDGHGKPEPDYDIRVKALK